MFSGPVYFELQKSPGNYIGAESNGDGTYDAIITPDGQKFNMIYPGLTNRLGTCSFESYSYPGYFLRHYNNELMMEKVDDPRFSPGSSALHVAASCIIDEAFFTPGTINDDATFRFRKDIWFQDTFTFDSLNTQPEKSIRSSDKRLVLEEYQDNDDYRAEASFYRTLLIVT